jgi:hypothetical protein
VGADKAYDTANHVANLRALNVTPHVTQYNATGSRGRQSAIDARTTRHQGYGMSQSRRAMIECIFGWGKQHGTMRKTKHRSISRVCQQLLCMSEKLHPHQNQHPAKRQAKLQFLSFSADLLVLFITAVV